MTEKGKIKVRAARAERPVPMEGPRRLGADGKDIRVIREVAVVVPNTRYYRRRIQKAELIIIEE